MARRNFLSSFSHRTEIRIIAGGDADLRGAGRGLPGQSITGPLNGFSTRKNTNRIESKDRQCAERLNGARQTRDFDQRDRAPGARSAGRGRRGAPASMASDRSTGVGDLRHAWRERDPDGTFGTNFLGPHKFLSQSDRSRRSPDAQGGRGGSKHGKPGGSSSRQHLPREQPRSTPKGESEARRFL